MSLPSPASIDAAPPSGSFTGAGRPASLPRPPRTAVAALGALFAVLLLAYALAWPQAPVVTKDGPSYMQLARDVGSLHLNTLSIRTPGLPLLLLLTGSAERPTRAFFYVSLLLHFSAVALLLYALFALGVHRYLLWTFCSLALLPPFVEPAAYVLSENLSEFAVVLAVVLVLLWAYTARLRFLLGFAFSAAFAALVRPTFQLLPVVAAAALAVAYIDFKIPPMRPLRFARALCLAAALSCGTIAAWSAVNYVRFGYFGPSSIGAYNLSTKTLTTLEELPDKDAALRDILIRYRDRDLLKPHSDHSGKDYIYRAYPDVRRYLGGDDIRTVKTLQSTYLSLIRAKPMSYLFEVVHSLGSYWMPNDYELASAGSTGLRYTWFALQFAIVGVFFLQAAAIVGLLVFYTSARLFARGPIGFPARENARLACAHLVGTATIVYCALVSCFLGTGEARYRQPTDLLIIAVALIGITIWGRLIQAAVRAARAGGTIEGGI